MKKKTLSLKKNILVGTTILSMLALSGCGNDQKEDASTDKVKITYAIWDDQQENGLKKIADEFNKKNDDIEVQVQVTPGFEQYWTKLDAAAKGQNLPDVFWMHSSVVDKYISNDMLMNLDDADIDWSQFPEGLVDLYSNDKGSHYAVPKDVDTVGLWYNKTLFDKADVEYPNENWTWEDFKNAGQKLTDKENGVYGFSAVNNQQIGYMNFIFQNDGKAYNDSRTEYLINDSNSVEAVEFYRSLIEDGISPTLDVLAESGDMFQSGKVAMIMDGSWQLTNFMKNDYLSKNCDVAVLPKQKRQATIYNGLGNCVAASTKHPEEAKRFVEYLGSKEANEIQGETATAIPAHKGAMEKWVNKTNGTFNTQIFIDMMDYGVLLPYSAQGAKVSSIQDEEMTKILSGNVSVQEGLDTIAEEATKALQ